MSIFDLHVGTCGCCKPQTPATPESVFNRPSLTEVGYRVGTYATFRRSMIDLVGEMAFELATDEGLSAPPLDRWTSRDSDDYGIAFVEMWAVVADILTFYSERYANEAWLRTATRRDSIRRLAAMLGYRPKPGVAAKTHLAFTLDDETTLKLPAGLLTQSVPKEGEKPQKFETSAVLSGDSDLNEVRIYGKPAASANLRANSTRETLTASSFLPDPGDEVLLFTSGGSHVEERTVATVDEVDDRSVVTWSRPLKHDHNGAFRRGRLFRLFGHSVEASRLVAVPQGTTPAQFLAWETATTDSTPTAMELDGTVDGIELGSKLLVVTASAAYLRTVNDVEQVAAVVGGTTTGGTTVSMMTGSATRVTLSGGMPSGVNLTTTVVYELGEELEFLAWQIPDVPIAAGTKTIYVSLSDVVELDEDRILVLDDDEETPLLVEVAEDAVEYGVSSPPEFLAITLEKGISRALDAETAYLLGNVAAATHGETISAEIVGDGDASKTLQEFELAKSPVTYTPDSTAPGGARSSLQVYVDRVRWREQQGLFGAAAIDRVYTTEIDDDQDLWVRFGDGGTGARLPTGRANVTATYRQGIGRAGNVDAGQIATALDRPTGLGSVVNPFAAAGGTDPETREKLRVNAPNTVRTFDRAVSLRDFADLAREFIGIEKAMATWVWDGEERVVHVTVGGDDGDALTSSQLADVRDYLDRRRDPNQPLRIDEYTEVPFQVTVTVDVDADYFNEDVHDDVVDAIESYFDYETREFGEAVHLSDIYAVVQGVDGVTSALVTALGYKYTADAASHGVTPAAVLVHAPVFGARHQASGVISPAELAIVEAAADILVTANGGLVS